MSEETIFDAAMELSDPVDRAAYLDSACRGDAALRHRVEALLQAHSASDSLLDMPPALDDATDALDDVPAQGPTLTADDRVVRPIPERSSPTPATPRTRRSGGSSRRPEPRPPDYRRPRHSDRSLQALGEDR